MTLVHVLVGLALASIVSLMISEQLGQSMKMAAEMRARSELEQAHFLANQKARNIEFLSVQLGITDAAGHRLSSELDRCLNARAHASDTCVSRERHLVETTASADPRSVIRTEIDLQMRCTNSGVKSCSSIVSTTHTALLAIANGSDRAPAGQQPGIQNGRSGSQTKEPADSTKLERDTAFEISGKALTSLEQIDFTCAAGSGLVSSIDLANRTALCDGYAGASSCTGGSPLYRFGLNPSCAAPIDISCPNGISRVGLFAGSGGCE